MFEHWDWFLGLMDDFAGWGSIAVTHTGNQLPIAPCEDESELGYITGLAEGIWHNSLVVCLVPDKGNILEPKVWGMLGEEGLGLFIEAIPGGEPEHNVGGWA